MTIEERKKKAKEQFGNHQATIVENNKSCFVVDWKSKNGSQIYGVRYILDIQSGNFIVTGDLGYSIASWHNTVYPAELKQYLANIWYYMEKLQCSSDYFTYKMDDALEDMRYIKEELQVKTKSGNHSSCELLEDIEYQYGSENAEDLQIEELLSTELDGEQECLICMIEEWMSKLPNLGKRVSPRVILWAVGYQMACDQLGI